jgi:pyroglutamyl-peptidase
MCRIFITAFEPYDHWRENASWLALVEFTKALPSSARITTRRYPVHFDTVRERLYQDLIEDYDFALHLGQAPGSASIRLEAIGLNIGGRSSDFPESFRTLAPDGPVAYRSSLPLGLWASRLRETGIPATVSYNAGTYLCNATMYLSHYITHQKNLRTRSAFIHVPLDTSQSLDQPGEMASLPASLSARALQQIVAQLITPESTGAPSLS